MRVPCGTAVCVFVLFVGARCWEVPQEGSVVFINEEDTDYLEDDAKRSGTYPNVTIQRSSIADIPLPLARKLSEVQSAEDLLQFLGNAEEVLIGGKKVIVAVGSDWESEISLRGAERNNIVQATPANCKPELQTISLVENPSPSVFYFPTCTRIERCGGCCSSELLTCEPTKKETIHVQIMKVEYRAVRSQRQAPMQLAGKEIIPIEKHLECKCNCRVKPSDCNQFQTYNQGDCKCSCSNVEERKKCEAAYPLKLWDSGKCFCVCRELKICSSGHNFDLGSCKCQPNPTRRNIESVYTSQGAEKSFPPWVDEFKNQEKQKKKILEGDKEEKNNQKVSTNLWQEYRKNIGNT